LDNSFKIWLDVKNEVCSSLSISPREVNQKFKSLSKPYNSFCKVNYIDYNFVVDQILQMSLPYSEAKQLNNYNQAHAKVTTSEQASYDNSVKLNLKTSVNSPINLNKNSIKLLNEINLKPHVDVNINLLSHQIPDYYNLSYKNKYEDKKQDMTMQKRESNNSFMFFREDSIFNKINNEPFLISREATALFKNEENVTNSDNFQNFFLKTGNNNQLRNKNCQEKIEEEDVEYSKTENIVSNNGTNSSNDYRTNLFKGQEESKETSIFKPSVLKLSLPITGSELNNNFLKKYKNLKQEDTKVVTTKTCENENEGGKCNHSNELQNEGQMEMKMTGSQFFN